MESRDTNVPSKANERKESFIFDDNNLEGIFKNIEDFPILPGDDFSWFNANEFTTIPQPITQQSSPELTIPDYLPSISLQPAPAQTVFVPSLTPRDEYKMPALTTMTNGNRPIISTMTAAQPQMISHFQAQDWLNQSYLQNRFVKTVTTINLLTEDVDGKKAKTIALIHQTHRKVFYRQDEELMVDGEIYKFNLSFVVRTCNKNNGNFHAVVIDLRKSLQEGASGTAFISVGKIELARLSFSIYQFQFLQTDALIVKRIPIDNSSWQLMQYKIEKTRVSYERTPFYAQVKPPLRDSACAYLIMNRFIGQDCYDLRFPFGDQVVSFNALKAKIPDFYSGAMLTLLLLELFHDFKNQVVDFDLIHLDVKLENIIGTLKKFFFIDYETARYSNERKIANFEGTRGYAAPEIDERIISKKSDIFSLGVCVALFCGANMHLIENRFNDDSSNDDEKNEEDEQQVLPIMNATVGTDDINANETNNNQPTKPYEYNKEDAWEESLLEEVSFLDEDNHDELATLINNMIELDPDNRPDIKECIKEVGVFLFRERKAALTEEDKPKLDQAHALALDAASQVEKILARAVHDYRALRDMAQVLSKAVEKMADEPICMEHFVQIVHIRALYGCKTKEELLTRIEKVFGELSQTIYEFNSEPYAKDRFIKKYNIVRVSFDYLEFIQEKLAHRRSKHNTTFFSKSISNDNNNTNIKSDNTSGHVIKCNPKRDKLEDSEQEPEDERKRRRMGQEKPM